MAKNCPDDFSTALPPYFRPYIASTKNVKADGHCGFRAIAGQLGLGEDAWGQIRTDLLNELTSDVNFYRDVFVENDHVERIIAALDCFTPTAPFDKWFSLPAMGHLVATTYNVALVVISRQVPLTYLPLRTAPGPDPKLCCIGLINDNHFIEVSHHSILIMLNTIITVSNK